MHVGGGRGYLQVRANRADILGDSFNQLSSMPKEDWKGRVSVKFMTEGLEEDGIDAGGLSREWFALITKQLFERLRSQ